MRLVSNEPGTRWSYKDGMYIFSTVVWLMNESDKNLYSLIDKNGKIIHTINK